MEATRGGRGLEGSDESRALREFQLVEGGRHPGLCAAKTGEEWEASELHRAATQKEGPSRRQKVQGVLAKPPVWGSQQRQALATALHPLPCLTLRLSLEGSVMYPFFG